MKSVLPHNNENRPSKKHNIYSLLALPVAILICIVAFTYLTHPWLLYCDSRLRTRLQSEIAVTKISLCNGSEFRYILLKAKIPISNKQDSIFCYLHDGELKKHMLYIKSEILFRNTLLGLAKTSNTSQDLIDYIMQWFDCQSIAPPEH